MDDLILVETLTKIKEAVSTNRDEHNTIIKSLEKLNGTVAQNCKDIESGRTNIRLLWGAFSLIVIGLFGFILQYLMR